jgi:hypothetical protein
MIAVVNASKPFDLPVERREDRWLSERGVLANDVVRSSRAQESTESVGLAFKCAPHSVLASTVGHFQVFKCSLIYMFMVTNYSYFDERTSTVQTS